jgi:hypothetical protein
VNWRGQVAAGAGITPITSTIAAIQRMSTAGAVPHLEQVDIVWVIRHAAQLSWFEDWLACLPGVTEMRSMPPKPGHDETKVQLDQPGGSPECVSAAGGAASLML